MNNKIDTTKLNKYEMTLVEELEYRLGGKKYKGLKLVRRIQRDIKKGDYFVYNMVTGGIGTTNTNGNLLAKLGVE